MVSDKNSFKVFISKIYFSLCDLDMQQIWPTWTIIKEDHIRIIFAKYGKNPTSSLGVMSFKSIVNRRGQFPPSMLTQYVLVFSKIYVVWSKRSQPDMIGEIHWLKIVVSRSFDLIEGHWEYKKHAVMLGCLYKAILREEGATHLQNGESWNQSRYQILL